MVAEADVADVEFLDAIGWGPKAGRSSSLFADRGAAARLLAVGVACARELSWRRVTRVGLLLSPDGWAAAASLLAAHRRIISF